MLLYLHSPQTSVGHAGIQHRKPAGTLLWTLWISNM